MELLQQQLLGRDRGPALWGVELAEGGMEPIEGMIRQLSDPPERMTVRNQVLDQDVGEQRAGALLLTSHQGDGSSPIFAGVAGFFSELLITSSAAGSNSCRCYRSIYTGHSSRENMCLRHALTAQ